jgi:prepilin-type N-terminal cleavage/methylation domain-containing protein
MKNLHKSTHFRPGFTLVELLIVIAIIAVLSLLVFLGARRGLMAANQSRTISQMREIGVAVAAWASENNNNEPMYFFEGRGDESHEKNAPTGNAPADVAKRKLCGGNPATLLYNRTDPSLGYIQDHTVFFAANQIWKAPSATDYVPASASTSRLWGTYVWVYPSVPADERSERQKSIMSSTITTVSREAYDNLLMFNDYNRAKNKYDLQDKSYFALFRDSTVRKVAKNGDIWGWYATGQ